MPTLPERSFLQRHLPRRGSRAALASALTVALSCTFLPASVRAADPLADVQRLYYGGQPAEAMRRADEALARDPADPTLRFMKGVMLADARREPEAIAVFEQLTEDFPDLAEPYNNLATLYAANARFDKARAALEQALRVNPSYATAWENLGDVLVTLAAQAYARANQLDPSNASAAPKLRAARAVVPPAGVNPLGVSTGQPRPAVPSSPNSPRTTP